jgi:hypothetical protein
MMSNPTTTVEPDESQMIISDHPPRKRVKMSRVLARMVYGGTTRSCWNFEPATIVARKTRYRYPGHLARNLQQKLFYRAYQLGYR